MPEFNLPRGELPEEVQAAFIAATVTALSELFQMEGLVQPRPGAMAACLQAHPNNLLQQVRLLRDQPGSLTVLCAEHVAQLLAERYLPPGTEQSPELLKDVVGELANVIAGQTKTALKGHRYHYTLSTPVAVDAWLPSVAANQESAAVQNRLTCLEIQVQCEAGTFALGVVF